MLVAQPEFETESTVKGEKIAMSLDENALVHIMNVLVGLYQDAELAVIREYSTNARDAHVEVGQTKPIEVDLPTQITPYLKIKDYGIGMDRDDIAEIYSLYGASTKRNTNTQIGSLGLGCKSALAYSNQFSLVGYKDGVMTKVSISRDDTGAGSMTILDECKTDETNGVEIIIPVKNGHTFKTKAENFFAFWDKGTVLINGKEPEQIQGLRISDKIFVMDGSINSTYFKNRDFVVMGGVPYPVQLDLGLKYGYNIVAYVEIGDVGFVPSREALDDSNKTLARLDRIKQEFNDEVAKSVQIEIDKATTKTEAVKALIKWRRSMGSLPTGVKYQGVEIPVRITDSRIIRTDFQSWHPGTHEKLTQIDIEYLSNSIFVTDFDGRSFRAPHKNKLLKWSKESGIKSSYFLLFDGDLPDICKDWVEATKIISFNVIKEIKLPRTIAGGSKQIKGSYDVSVKNKGYKETLGADINNDNEVFWLTKHDFGHRDWDVMSLTFEKYPDATIVRLPENRVNKFCRDFPAAKWLKNEIQAIYDKLVAELTKDEILSLTIKSHYATEKIKLLEIDKVNDPELKSIIKAINMDISKVKQSLSRYRYIVMPKDVRIINWVNPLNKYKLMNDIYIRHTSIDHLYVYLNTAYELMQKGELK